MSRDEARRLATEGYSLPVEVRLMFLAMANSNRIGHATFGRDEVRQLIQVVDRKTAELGPLSTKGFGNALNRAIDGGLLAGQTARRCLILPSQLWQMQAKSSSSCDFCGEGKNARMWNRQAS